MITKHVSVKKHPGGGVGVRTKRVCSHETSTQIDALMHGVRLLPHGTARQEFVGRLFKLTLSSGNYAQAKHIARQLRENKIPAAAELMVSVLPFVEKAIRTKVSGEEVRARWLKEIEDEIDRENNDARKTMLREIHARAVKEAEFKKPAHPT